MWSFGKSGVFVFSPDGSKQYSHVPAEAVCEELAGSDGGWSSSVCRFYDIVSDGKKYVWAAAARGQSRCHHLWQGICERSSIRSLPSNWMGWSVPIMFGLMIAPMTNSKWLMWSRERSSRQFPKSSQPVWFQFKTSRESACMMISLRRWILCWREVSVPILCWVGQLVFHFIDKR